MAAIRQAAAENAVPTRPEVLAAMRPRVSRASPMRAGAVEPQDDNVAAVIFVNAVEGGRFKEVDEIAGEP
jgi:hypothetical protein